MLYIVQFDGCVKKRPNCRILTREIVWMYSRFGFIESGVASISVTSPSHRTPTCKQENEVAPMPQLLFGHAFAFIALIWSTSLLYRHRLHSTWLTLLDKRKQRVSEMTL